MGSSGLKRNLGFLGCARRCAAWRNGLVETLMSDAHILNQWFRSLSAPPQVDFGYTDEESLLDYPGFDLLPAPGRRIKKAIAPRNGTTMIRKAHRN
jgi:hypothetical protein